MSEAIPKIRSDSDAGEALSQTSPPAYNKLSSRQITVTRADQARKGTFWRPVEHTLHQREMLESVRRKVSGDQPDKVVRREINIQLDEYDLLIAGAGRDYTKARIEDPYKRGRFMEGFLYVRALAAFVHEDEVYWAETIPERIGPGAIIAKAVRIEDDAQIGAYTELERGAHVRRGALVGARSVLRKGALVGEGSVLGAHSYLGQFSRVDQRVNVGAMSLLERGVNIGDDAALGVQDRIGLDAHINSDAWLDDSVRVGRNTYIGKNTRIGEMTTIGNHSHIGDRSTIGAESRLGDMVRVGQGLMLLSPTYAKDGAAIINSNLFANRPQTP